jgi:hypothetical protein
MSFLAGGPLGSYPASSRPVAAGKFTGVLTFDMSLTDAQDTTFFRIYSEIWNNNSPAPSDPWSTPSTPTTDWTAVPDTQADWQKVD